MTASDWPSLEDRLSALAENYGARLERDPHEAMPLSEVVRDLSLLLQGAAPDFDPERLWPEGRPGQVPAPNRVPPARMAPGTIPQPPRRA